MNSSHRAFARPARGFGRRAPTFRHDDGVSVANRIGDDVRLFALTFAGGFLFMSVYLA